MDVLLLDPQAAYAEHFVRLLTEVHGTRVVALHRSWRTRVMSGDRYPAVASAGITNYMIGDRPLGQVADMLRDRHEVVAVAPHHESGVLPLHELAVRLGLGWAQPEVVPMFRDKGRLKEHLRSVAPDLRVNASRVVSDSRSARDFMDSVGAARIVLKPNDGAGNIDVAFFDTTATQDELAAHFERLGRPLLAEEYIGGDEYYVNGQMDSAGDAHVLSVVRYVRVARPGKENVESAARTLKSRDPMFGVLAEYARDVMVATGLRRSPFHLEAKVDGTGPCLIEVAARLCGAGGALQDGVMHGFDVVGHALTHYLTDDVPPPPVDWVAYDRFCYGAELGVAERAGLICSLDGVREVEAMPEFVTWIDTPRLGQKVRRTLDLTSITWNVLLCAPTAEQLERACSRAAGLITWNEDVAPVDRVRGVSAYTSSKLRALSHAPTMLRRTQWRWTGDRTRPSIPASQQRTG